MSAVKGKNTRPELAIRKWLHKQGYRYRLHRKDLPGKPDIILPKHKVAIFVNGCFWHQHPHCPKAKRPESNQDFWEKKLNENTRRDSLCHERLKKLGWRVLIIWECEIAALIRERNAKDLIAGVKCTI